jgi:hypothetical protein
MHEPGASDAAENNDAAESVRFKPAKKPKSQKPNSGKIHRMIEAPAAPTPPGRKRKAAVDNMAIYAKKSVNPFSKKNEEREIICVD